MWFELKSPSSSPFHLHASNEPHSCLPKKSTKNYKSYQRRIIPHTRSDRSNLLRKNTKWSVSMSEPKIQVKIAKIQNASPFGLEVQLAYPLVFSEQQSILSISLSNHPLLHQINSEYSPDWTTDQSQIQTQLATNKHYRNTRSIIYADG